MSNKGIMFGLLLALFLIGLLWVPSMSGGQVTDYYETTRDYNQVGFTLITFQPVKEEIYSMSLPLQFQVIWNISLESLLPDHPVIKGCAYSIDDQRLVSIGANGPLMVYAKESYWYSKSIDISNLTQGNHKISIIAFQYYGNSSFNGLFNQTTTPITFKVDNTLPATTTPPTPTIPETSGIMAIPFLIGILCIAAITRYQKTANPTKKRNQAQKR